MARLKKLKFVNVNPMNMAIRCDACGIVDLIKSKDNYDDWINKGKVCTQKHSTYLELH